MGIIVCEKCMTTWNTKSLKFLITCPSCLRKVKNIYTNEKENILYKEYLRNYKQKKRKEDVNFKIMENMRNRLRHAISFGKKESKTIKYIGCSIKEIKPYIENQFKDGMSWENYGRGSGKWNIDHIVPCNSFDFSSEESIRKCFHYTNLQPLWCYENTIKSDKIPEILPELLIKHKNTTYVY